MNFLVEIGHPAHVHFFSQAIRELDGMGHSVHVVSRNKDITNELLERVGISFECFSKPARSLPGLMRELGHRWWRTSRLIRSSRIDLAASISGITTSFPARVLGARNVVFADTEDARLSNRIAFPFADRIYTPRFYLQDLGAKQRRYFGLHELSYLQGFDAAKAVQVRQELGLPAKYFFLRVVANDALHDRSIRGLGAEGLRSLIGLFSARAEVIVSAEGALPPDLEKYRRRFPIESVHAVLAGAEAFIGESPTMAVESSLLGTPAFLISERSPWLGNMVCLERDFRLLRCFTSWRQMAAEADKLVEGESKREWSARAEAFRSQTVPMRTFILDALLEGAR